MQEKFLFLFAGVVAYASIYHYTYENMLDRAVVQADEVAKAVADCVLEAFDSREELPFIPWRPGRWKRQSRSWRLEGWESGSRAQIPGI